MKSKPKKKISRSTFNFPLLSISLVIAFVVGAVFLLPQSPFSIIKPSLAKVKIVASFPVGVNSAKSSMDSIKLALEENNYRAGNTSIELIELDDGDNAGIWSPELEKKNAELAATDPTVVAYLGPQNSGAAKISMPILNAAGIVQISPSNTWPGLTKTGFAPGEPAIFNPTGTRHYFRVVTTDDHQGPAAAIWANELGYKKIYVVDDGEAYGKGIADLFISKSQDLGISISNQESLIANQTNPNSIASRVLRDNPSMLYFGGSMNGGFIPMVKQLRANGFTGAIMGPDALLDHDLIVQLGADAEGMYVTSVGIPVTDLTTPQAAKFRNAYLKRYQVEPEVFGATSYEATQIILQAIKVGGSNRMAVLEAVRATNNHQSMFGPISFDQNGDVKQKIVSANTISNGEFEFVKQLNLP